MTSALTTIVALTVAAAPGAADRDDTVRRFEARFPGSVLHLRRAEGATDLLERLDHPLGRVPAQEARRLVEDWPALVGFDPALSSLAPAREVSVGDVTAWRMGQIHQGLPVLDADVVVTARSGRAFLVSSGLAAIGPIDPAFAITREEAHRVASEALRAGSFSVESATRAVAFAEGRWRAVWSLEARTSRPLGRWRVLVDAKSPRVVGVTSRVRSARGNVYPVCPEAGAYEARELPNLSGAGGLAGQFVSVYSNCMPVSGYGYDCAGAHRQASADGSGNFLFTPAEPSGSDPFAETQTYFHLEHQHAYLAGLGFSGLNGTMPVAVNFTLDQQMACNAQFLGDAIIIGLCTPYRVNFAYDAASIRHEYSHGLVEKAAGLVQYELDTMGLQEIPGALNEGYADFFPAVVLDDPRIGRHVAPKFGLGDTFRDLDDVFRCSDIDGEVHDDGRIWAGANWAAYKATGKDPLLPKAVLQGLVGLTSRASIQDAATATVAAAAGMPPAIGDALRSAYGSRGLMDCGRVVPATPGVPVLGLLMNPLSFQWNVPTMPFVVQHKVTVAAQTRSLRITLSVKDKQSGAALPVSRVNAFVNLGTPVTYDPSRVVGQWSTAGQGTLLIDAPAAGDYYVLVVGQSFSGTAAYSFREDFEVIGAPGPDAGPPGIDAAARADAKASGPDAATDPGSADAGEIPGEDGGFHGIVVESGCGCGAAPGALDLALLALAAAWAARRFATARSTRR